MPKFLDVTNTAAARAKLEVSNSVDVKNSGAAADGTTNDTAAIQALLDDVPTDSTVYFGPGTYKTGPLTVSVAGVTLTGPGTLSFIGVANDAALTISADRVTVDGLRLLNLSTAGTATGNRQIGIMVNANDVGVLGNYLEGWQNGIVVNDQGVAGTSADERRNIRIHYNRVKDVVGVGGGASSSSSYGEDRGDGIVSWGAQVSIIGNVVNAKAGTDARIGIHVENLYGSDGGPNLHGSAMATITGNVITGRFRRGIVDEEVQGGTIVGNVVADATWWGICLARAKDSIVADNTILWTRTSTDNHGSSWGPTRAGIMVYGRCIGSRISGNTCRVTSTAELPNFIALQYVGSGDTPTDTVVTGNTVHVDSGGTITKGIFTSGGTLRTLIDGNHLSGPMQQGIVSTTNDQDVTICNNIIEGAITNRGISLYEVTRPMVSGNTVRTAGVDAIYAQNCTRFSCVGNVVVNTGTAAGTTAMQVINIQGSTVACNTVVNWALGVECYSSTALLDGMIYDTVTTRFQNGTVREGSYVHNGTSSAPLVSTTGTQELTNKTLTNAKVNELRDYAGYTALKFDNGNGGASVVNYVQVNNAATLYTPTIYGWGEDDHVSLNLATKGTGVVYANGVQVATISGTLTTPTVSSTLTFSSGANIVANATTGSKIGTGTTQKLGFWNATPIAQPTTTVSAAAFTANSGTAVNDGSTFDGYTLGQVVKALRNAGLLA